MPVSPFSRYRDLDVIVVQHETRGETQSLPVRRLPMPAPPVVRRHLLAGYETVDLLARNYLGRESLFWQFLDANGGRGPDSFATGELIDVPSLEAATLVRRSA
ncbi:MAG TPA: hypothetical protein VIL98_06170 [Gaiellaceae bacterium]